jgi:protein-tyrosine-phosphatase
MKKILFVCLGNICRSPMAEFVMKDLAGCVGGMPRTSERIIAGAR